MTIRELTIQRVTLTSSKSFTEVLAALDAAIGHPDMPAFTKNLAAAKSFADLEALVCSATGPTDLMEFARMDLGAVLRKRNGPTARQSVRLIVGNPVIMSAMVQHTPDAGSYAPVTILIDERPDGIHLSYDRMATYLSTYNSPEAQKVAKALDAKVEALLTSAAG